MTTPACCGSPEKFNAAITSWIDEHCRSTGTGFRCKKCGSEIVGCLCYVSVHDAVFATECAGWGEVRVIPIPYCPMCEPGEHPPTRSCIHV